MIGPDRTMNFKSERNRVQYQSMGAGLIADVEIQLAVPADAAEIAQLSRVSIEHGLMWRWTPRRVLACQDDASTNVVVTRELRSLAGFGIMGYGDDRGHLLLLAVTSPKRRSGIGSALLCWLESSALTAGIGVIQVEVRSSNTDAQSFYRNNGYAEVARLANYYQGVESAVRMEKHFFA